MSSNDDWTMKIAGVICECNLDVVSISLEAIREAAEWGDWETMIAVANDETHPRQKRAIQLLGQAIGLPAMEEEEGI